MHMKCEAAHFGWVQTYETCWEGVIQKCALLCSVLFELRPLQLLSFLLLFFFGVFFLISTNVSYAVPSYSVY